MRGGGWLSLAVSPWQVFRRTRLQIRSEAGSRARCHAVAAAVVAVEEELVVVAVEEEAMERRPPAVVTAARPQGNGRALRLRPQPEPPPPPTVRRAAVSARRIRARREQGREETSRW